MLRHTCRRRQGRGVGWTGVGAVGYNPNWSRNTGSRRADRSARNWDILSSLKAPWETLRGGRSKAALGRWPLPSADTVAVGLLLLFCLAIYHQLVLAGQVPVSFDALAYFYPNLAYLGASLREGRLPLWNPYLFAGAPFLANSQTGVFYPPNWLAALVPAPRAYAWSAALHAALAAVGAFAFGRRALGLGRPGALATALVFAFGGSFSAQVGHLNQLQAASWLPLLLLVGDGLLRRPRVRLAVLGGAVLCLQLLAGHSQVTYLSLWALLLYSGAFCAAALRDGRRDGLAPRDLVAWQLSRFGPLLLLVAVGGGLAAAQLLPTYELSRESIRAGGLGYDEAASFSLPPWKVLLALLPTFGSPTIYSEWLGYVGVSGLILAGLALALRPDRRAAAMLLVALVALALAFGKFDPLYGLAYRWVPGLALFRVPARWLLVYSFGLAGLAGLGLDALVGRAKSVEAGPLPAGATLLRRLASALGWLARPRGGAPGMAPAPTARCSNLPETAVRLAALAAGTVLALGLYQAARHGYPPELPGSVTLLAWAAVGALGIGLAVAGPVSRSLLPALCVALLAGELYAASGSLDLNRVNPLDLVTESVPEVEFLLQRPGLYRVLGVSENTFEIGRVQVFRDRVAGRISPEGMYDYLVGMKYKKTMTPNLPLAEGIATLDGYDGGVLPLRRYVGLKTLFPEEGENVPDGRLRVQLRTAPDPRLLGWLNVKYLVMDRARDVWLDGIYYDLAMPRTAAPGEPVALADLPPLRSASLGIVAHLEGADAPPGAEVAAVVVRPADGATGETYRLPLRAGVETAEGKPGPGEASSLKSVAPWLHDPAGSEYYARLAFPGAITPAEISVEYLWPRGRLVVRAMSLVGAEPGQERVVDLSPDLKLVYLGDAKIYEHRAVLPRAFVVGRVRLAHDDEAVLDLLRSPEFDAREEAVVEEADWLATGGGPTALGRSAQVRVAEYRPERVVVEADLAAPGFLVLTDAAYPGWRALVDGREQPILRTNYLFRGVRLEPGRHRVEFVYEPASLRAGLTVSGLTAALALVAGLVPTAQNSRSKRKKMPVRAASSSPSAYSSRAAASTSPASTSSQ